MSNQTQQISEDTKKLIDDMVDVKCIDTMGHQPEPQQPNPIVDQIIGWGNTLDFENIKPNSLITVKIGIDNALYAQKMQMGIIHQVLEPRKELLKQKKLTVMFMSKDDDISVIAEEDMNRAGWFKKEKSLIISPFDK